MGRLTLKRSIGRFWPRKTNNRKVILLYHSVGDTPWGLPEKQFREQLQWLSEHSQIMSLTDLLNAKENSHLQVAITFDDGYQSLKNTVAPLLLEKNIPATVYLNTGWISENEKTRRPSQASLGHYPDEHFLTWEEVKALREAHWEMGSHGVNHHDFKTLEYKLMTEEFVESKKQIEQQLQTTCLHFAYPFGRYAAHTKQAAQLAGYQFAAAVKHGPLHASSDQYALPRMNIDRHYSFNDFKNVVQGKWDFIGLVHSIRG